MHCSAAHDYMLSIKFNAPVWLSDLKCSRGLRLKPASGPTTPLLGASWCTQAPRKRSPARQRNHAQTVLGKYPLHSSHARCPAAVAEQQASPLFETILFPLVEQVLRRQAEDPMLILFLRQLLDDTQLQEHRGGWSKPGPPHRLCAAQVYDFWTAVPLHSNAHARQHALLSECYYTSL